MNRGEHAHLGGIQDLVESIDLESGAFGQTTDAVHLPIVQPRALAGLPECACLVVPCPSRAVGGFEGVETMPEVDRWLRDFLSLQPRDHRDVVDEEPEHSE